MPRPCQLQLYANVIPHLNYGGQVGNWLQAAIITQFCDQNFIRGGGQSDEDQADELLKPEQ